VRAGVAAQGDRTVGSDGFAGEQGGPRHRCGSRVLPAPASLPDDADPIEALHAMIPLALREATSRPFARVLAGLLTDSLNDPDLARQFREQRVNPRRQAGIDLIHRAIDTGRLRQDTDPELTLDQILGPLFYRWMITDASLNDALVHQLIDQVCVAAGSPPPDRGQ
jgi:hypothetical protein